MDEVAAAVGVTKPLLYNYFGNKDGLVLAVLEPAADGLLSTVTDAVEAAGTPPEALQAGIQAFFAFVEADREAWQILFDETLPASGAVAAAVARERERLTQTVVAALMARLPESARQEVEGLSVALLGAAEALARWWINHGGDMPAAQAAHLLITTVQPGLRQRAGRPIPEPEHR
jgi:AcrR family transcriptional regulator